MPWPKNFWYVIEESLKVKSKPMRIRRFGQDLVLWRDSCGKLHCFADRCPHRGARLSMGRVKGDCLQCPFHGFEFQGEGQCTLIPAEGKRPTFRGLSAQVYLCEEKHGLIWLWWGEEAVSTKIPLFEELQNQNHRKVFRSQIEYQTSLFRFLESMFDFGHFAFVHWLGRASKMEPQLNPLEIKQEKLRLEASTTVVGKLGEGGYRGVSTKTVMQFPATVMGTIPGKNLDEGLIFAAAAPVDEEKVWVTYRVYPPSSKKRWSLNWISTEIFMRLSTPLVNWEDGRMFATQTPKNASLKDQLVSHADIGIATFGQMWRTHLNGTVKEDSHAKPISSLPTNAFLSQ